MLSSVRPGTIPSISPLFEDGQAGSQENHLHRGRGGELVKLADELEG